MERDRFTVVSRVPIEDAHLTWKARGILIYLLSKPDGWDVSVAHLVQEAPDGKAAVMSALAELEEAGYLRRSRSERDERGQFAHRESVVYEEPYGGKSDADRGGLSDADNRTLVITEEAKTETPHAAEAENLSGEQERPPEKSPSAREIIQEFNAVFGTRFRLPAWAHRINGAVRLHPELTLADHRRVIEHVHGSAWWSRDRPATPALVYGTRAQFERCLAALETPTSESVVREAFDHIFGPEEPA